MDEFGNVVMPKDIQATAMTEWELCELFNVTAPTIRAGIKTLCKTAFEWIWDKAYHPTVRQMQHGGLQPWNDNRPCVPYQHIQCEAGAQCRSWKTVLAKRKTSIFFSLNTNGIAKAEYFLNWLHENNFARIEYCHSVTYSSQRVTDRHINRNSFFPKSCNFFRFLGVFTSVLPDFRSKPLKVFGAICHRSAVFAYQLIR